MRKITQKERYEEAIGIAWKFQLWMGFRVCDGEEDMLSLRKLVKRIEREAINRYKKEKQ
jgi:predicted AAA+ superfamily ATPase